MNYKHGLTLIATFIALYSYVPYFVGIYRSTTKPHVFSWFIWGLVAAIAFAIQFSKQAGPGAWVTGFSAFAGFFIALYSLKQGETKITRSDWITFTAAFVSIAVWILTKDPLGSVIILVTIDAFAFYPTFRKSWDKPYEELAFAYALHGIKWIFAIIALEKFNLTSWLYPASLVFMNFLFVGLLIFRRSVLQKTVITTETLLGTNT